MACRYTTTAKRKGAPCTMSKRSWELLWALCEELNRRPVWGAPEHDFTDGHFGWDDSFEHFDSRSDMSSEDESTCTSSSTVDRDDSGHCWNSEACSDDGFEYSSSTESEEEGTPKLLLPMESLLLSLFLYGRRSGRPVAEEGRKDVAWCAKLANSLKPPWYIITSGISLELGVPDTHCSKTGGRVEDGALRWFHGLGFPLPLQSRVMQYASADQQRLLVLERNDKTVSFPFEYHTDSPSFTWGFLGRLGILPPPQVFHAFAGFPSSMELRETDEGASICAFLMGALPVEQLDVVDVALRMIFEGQQKATSSAGGNPTERILPWAVLHAACCTMSAKPLRRVAPFFAINDNTRYDVGRHYLRGALAELCCHHSRQPALEEFSRQFPVVDVARGWPVEDFSVPLGTALFSLYFGTVKVLHEEFHVPLQDNSYDQRVSRVLTQAEPHPELFGYLLEKAELPSLSPTQQTDVLRKAVLFANLCAIKRYMSAVHLTSSTDIRKGTKRNNGNIFHLLAIRSSADDASDIARYLLSVRPCSRDNTTTVASLLEEENDNKYTPLERALATKRFDLLQSFLQAGARLRPLECGFVCIVKKNLNLLKYAVEFLHIQPALPHLHRCVCNSYADGFQYINNLLRSSGSSVNLVDPIDASVSYTAGRWSFRLDTVGEGKTWIQYALVHSSLEFIRFCFEVIGVERFSPTDIPKGTERRVKKYVRKYLRKEKQQEKEAADGSSPPSRGTRKTTRAIPLLTGPDEAQRARKKRRTELANRKHFHRQWFLKHMRKHD